MSLIAPAAELAGAPGGEDYLTRLEQASIGMSLENLLTFPYVAAAAEQELQLHGAYFDVATGQLSVGDVDRSEPEERV
jgi:carbonic anhydrase